MPPPPTPAGRPEPEPPAGVRLLRAEPLSRHTYLRLGGPARWFAEPQEIAELERLIEWAREHELSLRVLGGGSNLLVADAGVDALVVSLRRCCGGQRFEGTSVTAGAAVMLPALARAAAQQGLGGLEFAIGIPGSVGGALQSNAGISDGRDIGQLVERVEVLGGGGRQTLQREQLRFEYRRSSLRGSGVMVLSATLRLHERARELIEADTRALLEHRQATQPTADPNAGSIFRNPPGDHAGRLIDAAGCKGLAVGGARVSERHANFIVHDGPAADGAARADDVAALMFELQQRVRERFDVWLEPEIEWWGDGPPPPAFADREDGGGPRIVG